MSLDHDSSQDKIYIEKVTDVKYWGDTSNPSEHNPSKFRYLIYSTSKLAKLNMTLPILEAGGKMTDVDLFLNPDDLDKKDILNMSLIDENHTETFYSAGYLIRVPPENIRETRESEIVDNVLEEGKGLSVLSGDELLEASVPSQHNEVVAVVKFGGGSIEIVGVFYKVSELGNPLDPITAEKMEQHAHNHGWPIVKIVENSGYAEDSFEDTGKGLKITMDNKLFLLDYSDSEELRFACINDTKKESFLKVGDLEKIMWKYGDQIGDLESLVRKKYLEALKQYRKPKVEFDESRKIINVELVSEKDDEVKFILRPNGECDRVYWRRKDLLSQKLVAGIIDFYSYESQRQDCDYPLTSTEVQEIMSQAEDTMSVEEYQQLTDVFGDEELKAKIDKRAQNIYRARMEANENLW